MPLKTLVFLLTALVVSGIVHGRLTDRWGPPQSVIEAGQRLRNLPLQIDGWTASEIPVTPRMIEAAGAANILNREYVASSGGERVRIMLVCGRSGPVSLHPPTVCFAAGGLRPATLVESEDFTEASTDERSQFARCTFAGEAQLPLLTYWAWSSDGSRWSAPADPRFTFAHRPVLYKLYLMTGVESAGKSSPARQEFIAALLAELKTLLH